jgi:DNA-binding FrmR family transcriptional regulator
MYQVAGTRKARKEEPDMSGAKKTIDMKERGDLSEAAKKIGSDKTCAHEKDEELARSYDELAKSYVEDDEHEHDHEHIHDDGSHRHTHDHKKTKQVTNRLAKATGHLEKVRRMVEKGEDCTDVLIQLSAVIAALKKTGKVILEDHIQNCIVDAVKVGDEKAIEDLKNAIDRFLK